MRVATAAYAFNREGGLERAAYEVATRVAALGVEQHLYSHVIDPPPPAPIVWHPVPQLLKVPTMSPITFSRQATRVLDRDTYDVVHNQGGCALRRQDIITAHSCHRAWWQLKLEHGQRTRALLNPHHHAVLHVERAAYARGAYDQVIAVSHGVGRELQRFYDVPSEAISVIPNGVDTAAFHPADRDAVRAELRSQLGYSDDDVVLLFVSKEFRRKGLAPVIDALPHLPAHVRLLVVGGDDQAPFQAAVRERGVADRVHFAGHTSRVHDLFQVGDVFVLPTLYEAFALVTLEAAAAALPLVVTRVNGTEDFVREGRNGAFVDRSGRSVASVLRPLVDDPTLRRRLGTQARKDVQAYTWDAAAKQTLEVYREVAARKAAAREAAT